MDRFRTGYALLFNHIGQINWPWRVISFVGIYAIAASAVRSLIFALDPHGSRTGLGGMFHEAATQCGLALLAAGLTWLLLKMLEKRRWGSIGLARYPSWPRELALGVILGFAWPVIVALLLWLFGFVTLQVRPLGLADAALGLLGSAMLWTGLAVAGELVFRGYVLQTMSEGLGRIAGTIFMSFLYAALTLAPVSADIVCILNTFLLGLTLCIMYFRTSALWLPIGLHFAWIFTQGYLLGAPVEGIATGYSLFVMTPSGPNWMYGAQLGMEGGLMATPVILLLLFYALRSGQIRIDDQMRKIKYQALTTPFVNIEAPHDAN